MMLLLTAFLRYLVTSAVVGSEFFDPDEYDSRDECYDEFEAGDKSAWQSCCEKDSNLWSSANCEDKYYPHDVCYNDMIPGFIAAGSIQLGGYPTQQWEDCCDDHCNSLSCTPGYCYNYWDEIGDDIDDAVEDWYLPEWAIILISVLCGVAFFIALLLILWFCWLKERRKKKKAAELNVEIQQREDKDERASAGSLSNQYHKRSDSSSSSSSIPRKHHHVVQHQIVETYDGPPVYQDGINTYVHAPAYEKYRPSGNQDGSTTFIHVPGGYNSNDSF